MTDTDHLVPDGRISAFDVWLDAPIPPGQIQDNARFAREGSERGLDAACPFDEYGGDTIYTQNLRAPIYLKATAATGGNNVDAGIDSFTFGCVVKAQVTANSTLAGKKTSGTASAAGYAIQILSSGLARMLVCDGTLQNSATQSSAALNDDTFFACAGVVDRAAGELRFYVQRHYRQDVGGLGVGIVLEATLDISSFGSFANAADFECFKFDNGTATFNGGLASLFYIPAVLTPTELASAFDAQLFEYDGQAATPRDAEEATPLASLEDKIEATAGGSHWWLFDAGTGSTVNDLLGSVNLTVTGASWQDRDGTISNALDAVWHSTYEGGADLKGVPKPVTLGRCVGVAPVMVDRFTNEFQTSDPGSAWTEGGPLEAVETDYDGGLALDPVGPPPDYTVDLDNHVIALDGALSQLMTCDLRGLFPTGATAWPNRTHEIAEFLLQSLVEDPPAIDATGLADLAAEMPYQIGFYLPPETVDLLSALSDLMQARGWWTMLLSGALRFGALRSLDGATPDLRLGPDDLVEDSLVRVATQPVAWRVKAAFHRQWRVVTEFLGAVSVQERQRQGREFRHVNHGDAAVRDAHAGARILEVSTLIHKPRDARIEAERVFDVWSVPRDIYRASLSRRLFQVQVGDVVELTADRFGLEGGKNFLGAGTRMNPALGPEGFAGIELFGPFDPEVV